MERTWSKREPTSDQMKVGNRYRIPCVLRDGHFVPIYDHSHTDEETGQPQAHYHVDCRFRPAWMETIRIDVIEGEQIYHRVMECLTEKEWLNTPFPMIKVVPMNHENLKCKRCPHRGYYLGDMTPDETGTIKCPLHGTKVNIKSFSQ